MSTITDADKQAIKESLQSGQPITVTFTKRDGTLREMLCTTNGQLIPADKHPKTDTHPASEDVQRVFDVDKQMWRSFKWDSVISTTERV